MKKILFTVICLFMFACNFLTPSHPSDNSLLIGRHPDQWMQNYNTFSAINDILPFEGRYAKPSKEKGRVIYGISWNEPSCVKALSSPISLGNVEVALYNSISNAQEVYSEYKQTIDQMSGFQFSENTELGTEDAGILSFYQYKSCDVTAYEAEVMFRRNNVIAFVIVETFQENSTADLKSIVSSVGRQLDQLLLNEMNNHPGSEADIAEVISSADAIELPSSTSSSQSPADLGNASDYIEGDLYCDGTSGYYKVGGVLTNTSDYTINIMVEWGASPASNVSYTSSTRRGDTIVLFGGETRTISLYGAPFIENNEGIPYYGCDIFFQSTSWSN